MEKLAELKSSFKDITKYLTLMFVTLITIGAYIIQRSYMAVFLSDSLESDFIDKTKATRTQSQVSFSGLTFTYGSMNMFWPVIILLVYVAAFYILRKYVSILREIRNIENNNSEKLFFDPMNIFREIQLDKLGRFILRILIFIPLIGLITHLLTALFIFYKLNSEQVADPDSSDALIIQLWLQLAITFATLILSITLPSKILKTIKCLRE